MKSIKFIFFFILFLSLNIYGDIKYKVSGKVLRNGKGYKGFNVNVSTSIPIDKENFDPEKFINVRCKTDEEGNFVFYLPQGEYQFFNDGIEIEGDIELLLPVGPEKFVVKDKNISNLNINLYKESEIIEANLDILKEIPTSTPTVKYKWGRVPIHSEEDCKRFAEELISDVKSAIGSDIASSSKLGSPVIFYDFEDNPVFYQYPVVFEEVEIAFFGVHAIGLKPTQDYFWGTLADSENELKSAIKASKGKRITWDTHIPVAIERVAEKKNCSKDDIEFLKLLCLDAKNYGALYAMLKIIPKNEIVIVNLFNFAHPYLTDILSIEQIKEESELQNTLHYIIQVKNKRKKTLM